VNTFFRLLASTVLVSAAVCASERDAHAIGPVDIEVGARVGFATNPNSDGPNPFGLGVGGRGGVTIAHFYGGLSAIHYFGQTKDIPTPVGTISSSFSSTLLGVELGYSITAIPKLVIRPQVGVGSASFSFNDQSTGHVYFEPGATVLVVLGIVYFGADANLLVVPGIEGEKSTFTSVTLHGQIGVQF
jgi:hypothetical protein